MGNKKGRLHRNAKANNWKAMLKQNKMKHNLNNIELDVSLRCRLTRQETVIRSNLILGCFFTHFVFLQLKSIFKFYLCE